MGHTSDSGFIPEAIAGLTSSLAMAYPRLSASPACGAWKFLPEVPTARQSQTEFCSPPAAALSPHSSRLCWASTAGREQSQGPFPIQADGPTQAPTAHSRGCGPLLCPAPRAL